MIFPSPAFFVLCFYVKWSEVSCITLEQGKYETMIICTSLFIYVFWPTLLKCKNPSQSPYAVCAYLAPMRSAPI